MCFVAYRFYNAQRSSLCTTTLQVLLKVLYFQLQIVMTLVLNGVQSLSYSYNTVASAIYLILVLYGVMARGHDVIQYQYPVYGASARAVL